jgi:hypothetical protein
MDEWARWRRGHGSARPCAREHRRPSQREHLLGVSRRRSAMIALWLFGACASPEAPPSAPPSASAQRPARVSAATIETGDTATPTTSTATPSSCEGPPYPTQFDLVGDGWGWVDGTCWIDPEWPLQPCPEVHLGPPPGPGGELCQTRSDCPTDSDDGHWFCGAGACRRFEDEWLTLCVKRHPH